MSVQVYTSVRLEPVECFTCGVIFGMPEDLEAQRRRDKCSFYCPNGHGQHYLGKTHEQELKAARAAAERAEARARAATDQAEAAERSRRAQKAALTRTKNRIANGVCPCCKRSFEDLLAHMRTQHPDYAEE